MIIGIDFDNTIIDYHTLFFETALSLGIIEANSNQRKEVIREALVVKGREADWTRVQGIVYGTRIDAARVMEGFCLFLKKCHEMGWKPCIISHKTALSADGEGYDLHTPTLKWLKKKGISEYVQGVYLEPTREEKVLRINSLDCTIFIDDLPEVLLHPDLHPTVKKILYNPDHLYSSNPAYCIASDWEAVAQVILSRNIDYA